MGFKIEVKKDVTGTVYLTLTFMGKGRLQCTTFHKVLLFSDCVRVQSYDETSTGCQKTASGYTVPQ